VARILLIRHGQSEWNALGRWQGQADIALSDLGRAQARAASLALGTFDLIVSSTLQRAVETAAIISAELGVGPVIPIPELVERNVGEWSGSTREQIERAWPGYLHDRRRPPGYEVDELFWPRIQAGLGAVAELVVDPRGEALVVAHGGLIYHLEERNGFGHGRLENLGGLWLDVAANGEITIGERVSLIDVKGVAAAQDSGVL